MTLEASPARAVTALARDTAAAVALLERFGALLAEALEAAGRGADEDFEVAVAERGRIVTALGNRLAALAVARHVAQRDGMSEGDVRAILRPLDVALGNARVLHDHVSDVGLHTDGSTLRPFGLVLVR